MIQGFALSKAGHDAGTMYLICGEEKSMLLLIDGKHHKLGSPKRKNKKHLAFLPESVWEQYRALIERENLTDAEVRRVLASVKAREEVI